MFHFLVSLFWFWWLETFLESLFIVSSHCLCVCVWHEDRDLTTLCVLSYPVYKITTPLQWKRWYYCQYTCSRNLIIDKMFLFYDFHFVSISPGNARPKHRVFFAVFWMLFFLVFFSMIFVGFKKYFGERFFSLKDDGSEPQESVSSASIYWLEWMMNDLIEPHDVRYWLNQQHHHPNHSKPKKMQNLYMYIILLLLLFCSFFFIESFLNYFLITLTFFHWL